MRHCESISTLKRTSVSLCALAGLLSLAACSDGTDKAYVDRPVASSLLSGCADTDSCFSNPPLEIGGERLAAVRIPVDYNTSTRYPLIILLHGFGASGPLQAAYLGLYDRVDTQQYIFVSPNGNLNSQGRRYWNATPACCAFGEEEESVDDIAYIRGLITEAAATYSIDPLRVGLIGHSNGGFMALRMACEASDLVTAVVSLAGSTWNDDSSCAPATLPVNVLTLHGDEDDTIFYDGRTNGVRSYPSAPETIRRFAAHAGCDVDNPMMPANIDVLDGIAGDETSVISYQDCDKGVGVELWTMAGGEHIPFPWVPRAIDNVVDWIIGRPRI